jgi:ketosteroid isomerase-like protein
VIFEAFFVTALITGTADAARNELLCAEVGFSRAVESRDFETFIGFLDPEARFITGRVARGPDEIGQDWPAFFEPDGPRIRWRPAIVEVVAAGTLAISRGPYRLTTVGEDGKPVRAWGRFNSTWRRNSDGDWRVLFDAGGDHGMSPTDRQIALLESEPACP